MTYVGSRETRDMKPIAMMVVSAVAAPVLAGPVTFNYGDLYEQPGAPPAGSAPWLTAELTQSGDDVVLKLTNKLQAAGEFFSDIVFNFSNADVSVGDLVFTYNSGQAFESLDKSGSINGWGPAGKFDLALEYENANNANRFTMGEMSVYTISDVNGDALNPMDFLFLSDGNQAKYTAAHVQGLTGGDSARIAGDPATIIPLPGAAGLAGVGLGILAIRRRR